MEAFEHVTKNGLGKSRDASLQVGPGDPLELMLISKLQGSVPLEKMAVWEGGLYGGVTH